MRQMFIATRNPTFKEILYITQVRCRSLGRIQRRTRFPGPFVFFSPGSSACHECKQKLRDDSEKRARKKREEDERNETTSRYRVRTQICSWSFYRARCSIFLENDLDRVVTVIPSHRRCKGNVGNECM